MPDQPAFGTHSLARAVADFSLTVSELCAELDRAYSIISGMKKHIDELEARNGNTDHKPEPDAGDSGQKDA